MTLNAARNIYTQFPLKAQHSSTTELQAEIQDNPGKWSKVRKIGNPSDGGFWAGEECSAKLGLVAKDFQHFLPITSSRSAGLPGAGMNSLKAH